MTEPRYRDISGLLEARSVAVVGASDREGNIGGTAIRHMLKFGYEGEIFPVHPTAATVCGLPAYPSVGALPFAPDLAILAVPAARTVELAAACGAFGIRNGIVWAGGFAEAGREGVELQNELVVACRENDFNICGPNCLGVINTATKLTATYSSGLFDFETMRSGNISLVSQSGGLTAASMALAARVGFGFRHVASVGNEAVISAADFVSHFVDDPGVRVIAMYLEGVKDGPKLVSVLKRARAAGKPVIVLKGGSSAESARAAQSHTAVLSGVDKVFSAVMRECGVTRVYSLEELIDAAGWFSSLRPEQLGVGGSVAITTTGGGGGVLATDQCVRRGVAVPVLSAATVEEAQSNLTPLAAVGNPTDLTPESFYQPQWREKLPAALGSLAADPGIDNVLFLAQAMGHRAPFLVEAILKLRESTHKPVCVSWPLAPQSALDELAAQGVYVFPEHDRAARALSHSAAYVPGSGPGQPSSGTRATPAATSTIASMADVVGIVPEHRCRPLLEAAGLAVVEGTHAHSEAEAIEQAASLAGPVVMKGVTDEVTHRFAAGLVKLRLTTAAEISAAWHDIHAQARADGVVLDGVLIQRMAVGDAEFLVSSFRDPHFGVMISLGVGGVLTEVLNDVVIVPAPVSPSRALEAIRSLKLFSRPSHLTEHVDMEGLARWISGFSDLSTELPWPEFTFEINPLKVSDTAVVAVDSLIVIEGRP